MASYQFSCPACDFVFDARRRIAERDLPLECPRCGNSETFRRRVNPLAIIGTAAEPHVKVSHTPSAVIEADGATNLSFIDCGISGGAIGLDLKNSSANLSNVNFSGCGTAIVGKDSEITARGIKIK